jgi:two-component system OmpR family response regulator
MDDDRGDWAEGDGPILVVDDDPTLLRALGRILRHEGHEVIEAADGATALALSRQHHPSLVVLDYMMPGMDGETVLAMLRAEHEEDAPPTVLLTASSAAQRRAKQMGAVIGLEKPFVVEDLLDAVDRHRRAERRRAS